MKKSTTLLALVFLVGCAGSVYQIESSIKQYNRAAVNIKLGDSKERVLEVLTPTQTKLGSATKPPEAYKEGDDLIEIYYFRSSRQADGLTTDDEFAPYTFKNGELIGIGWTVLGGPKSRGKVIQPPTQIRQTTVVY